MKMLVLACLTIMASLPSMAQFGPMAPSAKPVMIKAETIATIGQPKITIWVGGVKSENFNNMVPANKTLTITEIEFSAVANSHDLQGLYQINLQVVHPMPNGVPTCLFTSPSLRSNVSLGTHGNQDPLYFHQNFATGICIPPGAWVTTNATIDNLREFTVLIRGYYRDVAPATTQVSTR